jgi:hypothetical protein
MGERVLKVEPRQNCRAVELLVDGEHITVYARGTSPELTEGDRAVLVAFARELRRRGGRSQRPRREAPDA